MTIDIVVPDVAEEVEQADEQEDVADVAEEVEAAVSSEVITSNDPEVVREEPVEDEGVVNEEGAATAVNDNNNADADADDNDIFLSPVIRIFRT